MSVVLILTVVTSISNALPPNFHAFSPPPPFYLLFLQPILSFPFEGTSDAADAEARALSSLLAGVAYEGHIARAERLNPFAYLDDALTFAQVQRRRCGSATGVCGWHASLCVCMVVGLRECVARACARACMLGPPSSRFHSTPPPFPHCVVVRVGLRTRRPLCGSI